MSGMLTTTDAVTPTSVRVRLGVIDLAAQTLWYQQVFGLVEATLKDRSTEVSSVLLQGTGDLELQLVQLQSSNADCAPHHIGEPPPPTRPGRWSIAVDDLHCAFDELVVSGALVAKTPRPGRSGRLVAYLFDPEDNLIELSQREDSRA